MILIDKFDKTIIVNDVNGTDFFSSSAKAQTSKTGNFSFRKKIWPISQYFKAINLILQANFEEIICYNVHLKPAGLKKSMKGQ